MPRRCRLMVLLPMIACLAFVTVSSVRGEPVHRITLEEYETTLDYWAEERADILTLERVGESTGGLGIHLLKITDPGVPDEQKQIALVTALHGGPERSGSTAVLHFVEWLLGDSDEARQTRQRQILLVMPINHPEAFFQTDRFRNAAGIDPYTGGGPEHWDLERLAYKSLDKAPEVKAVLEVVDEWQPDVHADMHGTGLQEYPLDRLGDRTRYQGQIMFEVTGSAYSNYALRPWDWRVTETMIHAGEAAGFPSDRFEADAQRSFHGPVMTPIADRTWRGQPNFYTAQYGYAKYHTMTIACEIGWEASGLARLQGLLQIGNEHWHGELQPGYPVDRVTAHCGHFVTSCGTTAAERRQSRVELWQQQGRFMQAILYPQTDGRDTYFVATSKAAGVLLTKNLDEFLAGVTTRDDVDADAFQKLVRSGPEILLAVDPARSTDDVEPPIVHGLGFRLRLPYQQPTIDAVRLNGRLLDQSPTDGWQSWQADGFTQVQINLPPQRTRDDDLFLITCEYTPDVVRRIGWTPPLAVLKKLKK